MESKNKHTHTDTKPQMKKTNKQTSRIKPISTENKLVVVRGEGIRLRENGCRGMGGTGFWVRNEHGTGTGTA